MSSDYYEILGVSRQASPEEIKKAFRQKAKKLHPDVNPAPEAQEEMKKVSAAYETLSNPQKRRAYDQGGQGGFGGFSSAGFNFDVSDLFDLFNGGNGSRGPIPRARRGNDQLHRISLELAEVVFGSEKEINFETAVLCERCAGSCSEPGTGKRSCSVCKGSGHVQRTANSLLGTIVQTVVCSACSGHGDIIEQACSECSGQGRVLGQRSITIKIPAGIDSGRRIQLRSEGEVGPAGGPAGDLLIEVNIKTHPVFHREGNDLIAQLTIPMVLAALGTAVELETFDGVKEIKVKPGTQPGDVIKLSSLGVKGLYSENRGDLLVQIEVQVPTKLTADEKELLMQFAKARAEEPTQPVNDHGTGMFSKLKEKFRDL